MAKQSGLGDYVAIDDSGGSARDLSNDVVSLTINTPQETLTVTGIDKSAQERIIGLQDFSISLNGVFNAASNKSHDGGNTSSNPKLTAEALVSSYDLSRGTDGSLNWTATLELQSGTVPTWTTV
jgi:hypothetical protein